MSCQHLSYVCWHMFAGSVATACLPTRMQATPARARLLALTPCHRARAALQDLDPRARPQTHPPVTSSRGTRCRAAAALYAVCHTAPGLGCSFSCQLMKARVAGHSDAYVEPQIAMHGSTTVYALQSPRCQKAGRWPSPLGQWAF